MDGQYSTTNKSQPLMNNLLEGVFFSMLPTVVNYSPIWWTTLDAHLSCHKEKKKWCYGFLTKYFAELTKTPPTLSKWLSAKISHSDCKAGNQRRCIDFQKWSVLYPIKTPCIVSILWVHLWFHDSQGWRKPNLNLLTSLSELSVHWIKSDFESDFSNFCMNFGLTHNKFQRY